MEGLRVGFWIRAQAQTGLDSGYAMICIGEVNAYPGITRALAGTRAWVVPVWSAAGPALPLGVWILYNYTVS
jgi:hypothetical protein